MKVRAPSAAMPKIVSKITRADMALHLPRLDDKCLDELGNTDPTRKAKLAQDIARYAHVYDLGGRVKRAKPVKGKGDQDGIQFLGEFKAHLADALGGHWYVASKAHVPKMFEEVLFEQLARAQESDPDASVEFLIRVGIRPPKSDKPSMTGYEWTVEPLVDLSQTESAVDLLFNRAAAPALTGPTPVTSAAETPKAPSEPDVPPPEAPSEQPTESRHSRRKAG